MPIPFVNFFLLFAQPSFVANLLAQVVKSRAQENVLSPNQVFHRLRLPGPRPKLRENNERLAVGSAGHQFTKVTLV